MHEKDLIKQIRQYLGLLSAKQLLHWARVSTTGVPRGNGKFSPNPDQAGLPDFMLWLPKGRWVGLEAKAPRGKPSEAQRLFQANMESYGHPYFIVRSLDDVIHVLRRYDIRL